MQLSLLMSTFALVAGFTHTVGQGQGQGHNVESLSKPYAFSYSASRYPGHTDSQHSEVRDGGVIRGQYSYFDPRQEIGTVQYLGYNRDFYQTLNNVPLDHPKNTDAVVRANNRHYYLYNKIANEHQGNSHSSSDEKKKIRTVEPGAVVDKNAVVDATAMVKAGAVIQPYARVLRKAYVGHGAVIGPYAVVGIEAVVGDGAVMGDRAVLRTRSRLGPGQVMAPGEVR